MRLRRWWSYLSERFDVGSIDFETIGFHHVALVFYESLEEVALFDLQRHAHVGEHAEDFVDLLNVVIHILPVYDDVVNIHEAWFPFVLGEYQVQWAL